MKNKNRLLKILLFSVLIIASLVTYLSYGVKEKMTSTKLDFDNNRSRITEILTSKSFYHGRSSVCNCYFKIKICV